MKKQILVIGGSSMVGSRFIELNGEQFDFFAPNEKELNLLDPESISRVVENSPAEAVINFAAFTNVGKAEEEKGDENGLCYKLNSGAVRDLANSCKKSGKYLIQISTEYVFDGKKEDGLYCENDKPNPINWYGMTKYLGEEEVKKTGGDFLIARITMPYRVNFDGKKDLARTFLQMLKNGQEIFGCTDVINTPTFIDDIAHALKCLIENKEKGIIHLSSGKLISPFEFAKVIAEKFNLDGNLIKQISFNEFCKGRSAPLLKNSGLSNGKFKQKFGEGILHESFDGLEILKQQMLY